MKMRQTAFVNKYRRGAFVNLLTRNPKEWEVELNRVGNLPFLQHIEVWMEYIPTGKERSILRDMLKGKQVILHGPFIHMSLVTHLHELGEMSLRRCHEAVEVASLIGAKVVTLHAGTFPVFETREIAFERLARRFSSFVDLNLPVVALENMPVRTGTSMECLGKLEDLTLFRSILPGVRFTLDVGHCLQNTDDFESFLRENAPRIADIHLHDATPGGRGHLRLGKGALDLPRLLLVLKEIGFTEYVSLETISPKDTVSSWKTWLDAERTTS